MKVLCAGSHARRCGLLVAALLVAGCSGGSGRQVPTGKVAGTVTYKGKPVGNAAVFLVDSGQGAGGGSTLSAEGQFTLEQPIPVGTYKVFLGPMVEESADGQPKESTPPKVPAKYLKDASSDVSVEIKEGENELTVELKD